MKLKNLLLLAVTLTVSLTATAQQRTVNEVKRSIGDFSIDIKGYQSALAKIKGALTHEQTKDRAETWWVAARVDFDLYDKYRVSKSVGNTVNEKDMAQALLEGYDYSQHALELDTVRLTNKDGSPKVDKKTGKQQFKTKYSKEIHHRLNSYVIDFSAAGAMLYNASQWQQAIKAWDRYHTLAAEAKKDEPDTLLGYTSYLQGLASIQLKDNGQAHQYFEQARNMDYHNKGVYDRDLHVLALEGDTAQLVAVARKAYKLHGKNDIRYMRILINDCVARKDYASAQVLLDQATLQDSLNADYYQLKGSIVELQSGYKDARPFYRHAVELNPASAQAQFDYGRCFYTDALQYTRDNSKMNPKRLLKEVSPTYSKALEHIEEAYKLDPSNTDVRNILRDIYYKLGDGEKLDKLDRQ